MLRSLQVLHKTGYTHNDIKPGNIMIDRSKKDSSVRATLIDFGFSMKFISAEREHLKIQSLETFKGNISFSSLN
jgi:serine/threonine protein kinase